MRKFLGCWFVVVCIGVLLSAACAGNALVKITDNVYSYADVKDASPANSFGANAGIVVGKDAILVIDTLGSSKEAKRFIKDIRAVSDKPIKYVVNTHNHLDHTFGNSEFSKLGATIISHTNCRAAMEKTAESVLGNAQNYGLTEEDLKGTTIAWPRLTFSDRIKVDVGGLTVEIGYIAPSHTAGSVLVYLPGEKALFTGDILFTDFHPFMGDGDVEGWIKTLDAIMDLNVDKIIPGHGPVSGKKDLVDMKKYLKEFDSRATELCAGSGDLEYIVTEITKSLPKKTRGEWLIKTNIQMKYLNKSQNKNGTEMMEAQQSQGPFCQSCSMPMEKPADFGTGAGGTRINDYCRYCFKNGAFTAPDVTMEQMIEKSAGFMAKEMNMPEVQAKAMLNELFPKLKRWQSNCVKPQ